jgi:hypothetical protein
VRVLKLKLLKSVQESAGAQREPQEMTDTCKEATTTLAGCKVRHEVCTRQLVLVHGRMQSTATLLETTQCDLTAVKACSSHDSVKSRTVEGALEASDTAHTANTAHTTAASQLSRVRTDYWNEKQRNVELLMRME